MKTVHLILALTLSCCIFVPAKAQSFTYDTIPNPNKPQQTVNQSEQSVQAAQTMPKETVQPKQSSGGFNPRHLVFGGSFGMVFGDYTSINVSPQIGYEFNKYLTLGGGVSYNYYHYSGSRAYNLDDLKYTYNYLGLNLYARVNPIRFLALHIQPEFYNMWGSQSGESIDNKFVPCILAGGGLTMPIGSRGGITTMILYDILQNDWSPYGNQVVYTIGYTVGF